MSIATLSDRITHLKVESLKLHEHAATVPGMRPNEWTEFLADVSRRGVLEPIIVQDGGIILDGRNRWEAAKLRGDVTIACIVRRYSEAEQLDYLIRSAVLRRQLTDYQRGILSARLREPHMKAVQQEKSAKGGLAGGRGRTKDSHLDESPKRLSEPVDTRKEFAAKFDISESCLRQATIVNERDPQLADKVLAGEVSLTAAMRKVAPESSLVKPRDKSKLVKGTGSSKFKSKSAECRSLCDQLQDIADQLTKTNHEIKSTEGRLKTHEFDVEEQSKRMRMARTLVMQVRSTIKGD